LNLMDNSKESKALAAIREMFIKEKLDPKNVIEFFCTKDKLEKYKAGIRKKCTGECFFFTKETEQKTHVIALVNVSIEKMSNDASLRIINRISETAFKESSFSPIALKFVDTGKSSSKTSPKTKS
jgi:hypothetical protein